MDDDRVWTRARARDEGVSRARLTGGVEFVKVSHGRYLEAAWAADLSAKCAAALSKVQGGCVSHWTALQLHGLPVPLDLSPKLHILVPTGSSAPRDASIIGHHADKVVTYLIGDLPVTGAVRSWCDAASIATEVHDLVAAGDALWRRRPTTIRDITIVLSQRPGERGVALARSALTMLDKRAESAMESRLRVVLTLAGLAPPAVNYVVRDPLTGAHLGRVDLAWPEQRLAVEYDGDYHRATGQWVQDLRRREGLERAGWAVIVVVASDLLSSPARVVARLRSRLASRVMV